MKTIDFSIVKESISMVAFFEGVMNAVPSPVSTGSTRRYGLCPACGFHESSHRVSVIPKGFNCFSCNAKGDVIDAAQMYWGVSKSQAAQMLMDGSSPAIMSYLHTDRQAPIAPDERDDSALAELVKSMLAAPNPDDGLVHQYLRSRGISDRVIYEGIARNMIVALPGVPAHAGNWLNKYIGLDVLKRSKILKEGRKTPAVIYKPLCFIGDNGASIEFRIAGAKTNDKDIKSIRYGAGSPWTWKGTKGTKGVMVTEGVIDLLSAVELGTQRTVVALPGCQSWRLEWFDQYKGQQILLALDADGPGQLAAAQMKTDLQNAGHEVHIYQVPNGHKDLNDHLVAKTIN